MPVDVVWLQPHGLVEIRDRLVRRSHAVQHLTEKVTRPSIAWIGLEPLPAELNRLLRPAGALTDPGQGNRFIDRIHRLLQVPQRRVSVMGLCQTKPTLW